MRQKLRIKIVGWCFISSPRITCQSDPPHPFEIGINPGFGRRVNPSAQRMGLIRTRRCEVAEQMRIKIQFKDIAIINFFILLLEQKASDLSWGRSLFTDYYAMIRNKSICCYFGDGMVLIINGRRLIKARRDPKVARKHRQCRRW